MESLHVPAAETPARAPADGVDRRLDLAVCIVNHEHRDLLAACLESVGREAVGPAWRIIVVDNHSGDGSLELLAERFPHVTVIANETRRSFAVNQNLMLRGAARSARYVMMLNDDMELLPGGLAALVQFLDTHAEAAAVAAQLLWPDGRVQVTGLAFPSVWRELWRYSGLGRLWRGDGLRRRLASSALLMRRPQIGQYLRNWNGAEPYETDAVCGGAVVFRAAALHEVGLLDEGYPMYVEDVDWCRRARARGWRTFVGPRARVVHHGGASGSTATRIAWERSTLRYFTLYHRPVEVLALRAGLVVLSAVKLVLLPVTALVGRRRRLRLRGLSADWFACIGVMRAAFSAVAAERRIPRP
jgi:N-acetylglucosaminyl-diphospho-decaprenol L-rhamnosyltransferase